MKEIIKQTILNGYKYAYTSVSPDINAGIKSMLSEEEAIEAGQIATNQDHALELANAKFYSDRGIGIDHNRDLKSEDALYPSGQLHIDKNIMIS
jgi:hypothetical protein